MAAAAFGKLSHRRDGGRQADSVVCGWLVGLVLGFGFGLCQCEAHFQMQLPNKLFPHLGVKWAAIPPTGTIMQVPGNPSPSSRQAECHAMVALLPTYWWSMPGLGPCPGKLGDEEISGL